MRRIPSRHAGPFMIVLALNQRPAGARLLEHSETIDHRPGAWRLLFHYATADGVPRRSFKVALIVGTALNLINQGDALFGPASINWLKLILTYLMPYAVSTYGAVAVCWDRDRRANPQHP
jgi:hypothetical protein